MTEKIIQGSNTEEMWLFSRVIFYKEINCKSQDSLWHNISEPKHKNVLRKQTVIKTPIWTTAGSLNSGLFSIHHWLSDWNCPQRSSLPICSNACTSQVPFSAMRAPSLVSLLSSGSVSEPISLSPENISSSPPLFPGILCPVPGWLGSLCPRCCRVRMCSSVSAVWIKIVQRQSHPRPCPEHYLSEAKCSFWISHSVVITLREGLIAGSALSC